MVQSQAFKLSGCQAMSSLPCATPACCLCISRARTLYHWAEVALPLPVLREAHVHPHMGTTLSMLPAAEQNICTIHIHINSKHDEDKDYIETT